MSQRPSLSLTLGAALLAMLVFAASGYGFPNFSAPYTQRADGNCDGDPSDPVNIVFVGGRAGTGFTANQIEAHALWHVQTGSQQNLRVNVDNGGYACRGQGTQRASDYKSRFHTRLWNIPAADRPKRTVGDAHHEDLIWKCGWKSGRYHCYPDCHAVDSNGSRGSGFDQGRRRLAIKFRQGRHRTENDMWGNTRNFKQCDGDWAGSNGIGTRVNLNH